MSQDTLKRRSRLRKNLRRWSLLTSVGIGVDRRLFVLIGRVLQSIYWMLGVGLAAHKAPWSRRPVAVAVAEGTQVVGVVLQKIHAGGVHVVEGYRQVWAALRSLRQQHSKTEVLGDSCTTKLASTSRKGAAVSPLWPLELRRTLMSVEDADESISTGKNLKHLLTSLMIFIFSFARPWLPWQEPSNTMYDDD